jgi:hypothetical protein
MDCERCGVNDRHSLGLPAAAHPEWVALCLGCDEELTAWKAEIKDEAIAYRYRQQLGREEPVTRTRRSWVDALPRTRSWRAHYENSYY